MIKLFSLIFIFSMSLTAHGLESKEIIQHGQQTLVDSIDTTGLWILGVGTVSAILAHDYDTATRNAWKNHQKISENDSRIGDYWGQGVVLVYGAQYYFDKKNALPGMEGLLIGGTIVQLAKYSIARPRPNKKENVSMPSGHTQAAFSLATSMSESYGYLKALPFWGMAVFTGLSRISDDQHWLSDVVAGATIGIAFGRAAYKHHTLIQPNFEISRGRMTGGSITLNYKW